MARTEVERPTLNVQEFAEIMVSGDLKVKTPDKADKATSQDAK